jgi:DNA-binding response OmpR family regulator
MSEPYLGLLIGAAPDLPPLFESQSDDLEWMVVQTSSLTVALNRLRRRTYHLVIAEHRQASGPASELVAAIREAQPGVKVIVIDAVPSNADVIEAMQQKAFSYFSRPFDPAAVRDMIERAVTEPGWDDGIRVLSADPEFLTLKIRCNIPTADRLQQFFEELKNDLDPEERCHVAMAFREMLLNAIEHGGKLDPNEWVRVSRVRSDRSLVYHMEDPGLGFSRSALEHAAVASSDASPVEHLEVRKRQACAWAASGCSLRRSSSTKSSITRRATRSFWSSTSIDRLPATPLDRARPGGCKRRP